MSEEKTGAITVPLTDRESTALAELSNLTDLPQDRVLIQALRLYQQSVSPVPNWPVAVDGVVNRIDNLITERWLRTHGFRIEDNRNDPRLPLRRLPAAWAGVDGRQPFESPDDLCIDIAPSGNDWDPIMKTWRRWHCWVHQMEPYRHIHVRFIRYTWEVAKLYEGLTGRCWPGSL